MIKEITLPSGNKAVLDNANFSDICRLKLFVAKAIESSCNATTSLENFTPDDILSMVKGVPSLIESDELREIVLSCGKKCVVAGQNLAEAYFNKAEHWADYYPLMSEIILHNLTPFLTGLKAMAKTVKIPPAVLDFVQKHSGLGMK